MNTRKIPQALLTKLMERSERQIERGEYVEQNEMEELVAAW